MTRNEILTQLKHAMKQSAKEAVNWDDITEDTKIAGIGFDSLSILDLIYDVQQVFEIEFEAEELAGVKTVGQLVSFMEKKLPA
jgi:acyl carrier protein